jgi:hypothetical protein
MSEGSSNHNSDNDEDGIDSELLNAYDEVIVALMGNSITEGGAKSLIELATEL